MKSLAAEAVINRREAGRLSGVGRAILNEHRRNSLRLESRAAQLAYAYARGVPRDCVEPKRGRLCDYHRAEIIKRGRKKLESAKWQAYIAGETPGWLVEDFGSWLGE